MANIAGERVPQCKPLARLSQNSLFRAEPDDLRPLWLVPLELKNPGLSPGKVTSQLQGPARVAEHTAHGVSSARFVRVSMHGGKPHRPAYQQELAINRITFRRARYSIITMPYGSSLADARRRTAVAAHLAAHSTSLDPKAQLRDTRVGVAFGCPVTRLRHAILWQNTNCRRCPGHMDHSTIASTAVQARTHRQPRRRYTNREPRLHHTEPTTHQRGPIKSPNLHHTDGDWRGFLAGPLPHPRNPIMTGVSS